MARDYPGKRIGTDDQKTKAATGRLRRAAMQTGVGQIFSTPFSMIALPSSITVLPGRKIVVP